jgi:hypothetical protein
LKDDLEPGDLKRSPLIEEVALVLADGAPRIDRQHLIETPSESIRRKRGKEL